VKFEWDGRKAAANLAKHGVNFDEATEVFDDPHVFEGEDERHFDDEARSFGLGHSSKRLLFVIFTERHGDLIRIISARPPTPSERRLYEQRER
jgi:uncharacterized DUF497 family protein